MVDSRQSLEVLTIVGGERFIALFLVQDRASRRVATAATLEQGVEESTPGTGEGVKLDVPRRAAVIEASLLAARCLLLCLVFRCIVLEHTFPVHLHQMWGDVWALDCPPLICMNDFLVTASRI